MWTRKDLKARGKTALKRNYGKTLLVGLVLFLLCGGGFSLPGARFNLNLNGENADQAFPGMDNTAIVAVVLIVLGIIAVASIIAAAISVFVLNPLQVGCQRFFVKNNAAPADPKEMGFGFKANYKNVVLTMFLTNLFIFLWSLLFIVPGIVKGYAYRMVPYLLAEDPNLGYKEAMQKSNEMMMGQKGAAFVLDLSFLGWQILSGLTMGLLGILYVNPYQYSTNAELYRTLKGDNAPIYMAQQNIAQ